MKKFKFYIFSLMLISLVSCEDTFTETVTYKINEPVFMDTDDFRASIKVSQKARGIENQGKICFYEGYLYVSEPGIGIHIIDNRNPSSPEIIGFIELMGNADLSIRNNLLYADSYIDLVWFDISNPALPVYAGRIESIFPEAVPVIENGFGFDYNMCYGDKREDGVIVGWKLEERTEDIDNYTGGWFWKWGVEYDYVTATPNSGASTGVNGSMSRFALYNDKLYAVVNDFMSIFDLTGDKPVKAAENMYVGWGVETLFSYKDNMFMGTPTGMLIYSVTDPLKPVFMSSVTHIFGCDPVVVYDDKAYVTVHSGNVCGQSVNELFIVDVSDVANPKRLKTYPMDNPKGLGIDKGMLFLCDDGLKIFSLTTPDKMYLQSLKHIDDMKGYDLIAYNDVLMMIAEDGLYQFDYSDIEKIKFLSKLPFGAND